jgi:hypothetical protein
MPAFYRRHEAALAQPMPARRRRARARAARRTHRAPCFFRGLCPRRNSRLHPIRATLSALSMRAKCGAKIRSLVHDRRNDPACRCHGRLRFNGRRHAQRWATPTLAAPASRFPTTGSSPALQALAGRKMQPCRAANAQPLGGGIDTGENVHRSAPGEMPGSRPLPASDE